MISPVFGFLNLNSLIMGLFLLAILEFGLFVALPLSYFLVRNMPSNMDSYEIQEISRELDIISIPGWLDHIFYSLIVFFQHF
jgi:hypothetical protein